MEIRASEKQSAILADDAPGIQIVSGGYGSGKTRLGVFWLLARGARLSRYGPILATEPTYPMVRDVMERTLADVLAELGIRHEHWAQAHRWEIHLGASRPLEVICRSLDNPRSVEGINAAALWADEWELCDPDALRPAIGRVRAAPEQHVLLTGTPEGYGPAWSMLLREPAPTTRQYVLSSRDNPWLPRSYVDDISRALGDDALVSMRVDGVRTARGGRVYSRFDRRIHCGAPVVDVMRGEWAIACDFNVGTMHWLICLVDDERVHVVEELIGKDTTTDEQAERIARRIAELEGVTRRDLVRQRIPAYCDASGAARSSVTPLTHVSLLVEAGFAPKHGAANPLIDDRVNTLQVLLRDSRLSISPRGAPELVRALESQGYDGQGKPEKTGDIDHGIDALGYLATWRYPVRARRPSLEEAGRAKLSETFGRRMRARMR